MVILSATWQSAPLVNICREIALTEPGASRIEDKNIYKLVKEEMRNIDFSNFYLYEERWHKEFGKRTQRQNIGAKIF